MSLDSSKRASDLSEEEKALIRQEVERVPYELKSQRRRELANEYGVELRTIGAITAWTVIRAKRELSEDTPLKLSSVSPKEHRHAVHMQIMRNHFYYNHAISRPIERTRFEIQQIFQNIYQPDEIDILIQSINNKDLSEEKIVVELPDLDAQLGERVDYDNEKKNENREWWLNLLWQYTKEVDKSKLKLLLLPGPECHEVSPIISMGFPPENLLCYNLGKDPSASAVFIRNCQEQGVFNWELGDLINLLPHKDERIYGGNLDFTGFYSEKNERILSYLPVPKNGRMYFSINLQKKRERNEITSRYREVVAHITVAAKEFIKNLPFIKKLRAKAEYVLDASSNGSLAETSDARKKSLKILIQENLGSARSENWICSDEVRKLVLTSGRFPDFDNFDSYDKLNAARQVLTTFEDELVKELFKALKNNGCDDEMAALIANSLMTMTRDGFSNKTHIKYCHQTEYCSPTGSPFISHFMVCENFYNQYRTMEKSIRFFLKCMTNLIKDIEASNSDEVIQRMRSASSGESIIFQKKAHFVIQGKSNNKKLIFVCANHCPSVEIPISQIESDVNRMIFFLKNIISSDSSSETSDLSPQESFDLPTPQKQVNHTVTHGEKFRSSVKIGRNDPCYCGSGKKFKKCCGNNSSNSEIS